MVFFSTLTGHAVRKACFICIALSVTQFSVADASNLTFQGQNAGLFSTANPSDTAVLMNSVAKPTANTVTPSISPSTLVEQSIISQISTKIYNDLFKGSAASGSYDLGGGNRISYVRSGGYVTVDITSPSNGTTTLTVLDL